jgi:hypothetical protein
LDAESTEGRSAGAGAGAASGAATGAVVGSIVPGIGTGIGALVGGVAGAVGGSGVLEDACIIVTASTSRDSEEVMIARRYRDEKMSPEEIRGYYIIAEPVAERMGKDPEYKAIIKVALVEPMIAYGKYCLGIPMNAMAPTPEEVDVTHRFLDMCRVLGSMVSSFKRSNGEVV